MKPEVERGAASLLITLSDGNVVVTHGTDHVELARLDNAPAGTWGDLWESLLGLGLKTRY